MEIFLVRKWNDTLKYESQYFSDPVKSNAAPECQQLQIRLVTSSVRKVHNWSTIWKGKHPKKERWSTKTHFFIRAKISASTLQWRLKRVSICLSPTTENLGEDNSVWRHCGKEGRRFNKMSLRQFLCRSPLSAPFLKRRTKIVSGTNLADLPETFVAEMETRYFLRLKIKRSIDGLLRVIWDVKIQLRSNLLTYVNANFRLPFQSSVDLKGGKISGRWNGQSFFAS